MQNYGKSIEAEPESYSLWNGKMNQNENSVAEFWNHVGETHKDPNWRGKYEIFKRYFNSKQGHEIKEKDYPSSSAILSPHCKRQDEIPQTGGSLDQFNKKEETPFLSFHKEEEKIPQKDINNKLTFSKEEHAKKESPVQVYSPKRIEKADTIPEVEFEIQKKHEMAFRKFMREKFCHHSLYYKRKRSEKKQKTKEFRFLFSNVNPVHRHVLTDRIIELGGVCLENGTKEYNCKCTHLIMKSYTCSEKLMGALASGIWVLDPTYIHSSYREGRWLNEEGFEVDEVWKKHCIDTNKTHSKEWRKFLEMRGKPVFSGWTVGLRFYSKHLLTTYGRILMAGGAKVEILDTVTFYRQILKFPYMDIVLADDLEEEALAKIKYIDIPFIKSGYLPLFLLQDIPPNVEYYLFFAVSYTRQESVENNSINKEFNRKPATSKVQGKKIPWDIRIFRGYSYVPVKDKKEEVVGALEEQEQDSKDKHSGEGDKQISERKLCSDETQNTSLAAFDSHKCSQLEESVSVQDLTQQIIDKCVNNIADSEILNETVAKREEIEKHEQSEIIVETHSPHSPEKQIPNSVEEQTQNSGGRHTEDKDNHDRKSCSIETQKTSVPIFVAAPKSYTCDVVEGSGGSDSNQDLSQESEERCPDKMGNNFVKHSGNSFKKRSNGTLSLSESRVCRTEIHEEQKPAEIQCFAQEPRLKKFVSNSFEGAEKQNQNGEDYGNKSSNEAQSTLTVFQEVPRNCASGINVSLEDSQLQSKASFEGTRQVTSKVENLAVTQKKVEKQFTDSQEVILKSIHSTSTPSVQIDFIAPGCRAERTNEKMYPLNDRLQKRKRTSSPQRIEDNPVYKKPKSKYYSTFCASKSASNRKKLCTTDGILQSNSRSQQTSKRCERVMLSSPSRKETIKIPYKDYEVIDITGCDDSSEDDVELIEVSGLEAKPDTNKKSIATSFDSSESDVEIVEETKVDMNKKSTFISGDSDVEIIEETDNEPQADKNKESPPISVDNSVLAVEHTEHTEVTRNKSSSISLNKDPKTQTNTSSYSNKDIPTRYRNNIPTQPPNLPSKVQVHVVKSEMSHHTKETQNINIFNTTASLYHERTPETKLENCASKDGVLTESPSKFLQKDYLKDSAKIKTTTSNFKAMCSDSISDEANVYKQKCPGDSDVEIIEETDNEPKADKNKESPPISVDNSVLAVEHTEHTEVTSNKSSSISLNKDPKTQTNTSSYSNKDIPTRYRNNIPNQPPNLPSKAQVHVVKSEMSHHSKETQNINIFNTTASLYHERTPETILDNCASKDGELTESPSKCLQKDYLKDSAKIKTTTSNFKAMCSDSISDEANIHKQKCPEKNTSKVSKQNTDMNQTDSATDKSDCDSSNSLRKIASKHQEDNSRIVEKISYRKDQRSEAPKQVISAQLVSKPHGSQGGSARFKNLDHERSTLASLSTNSSPNLEISPSDICSIKDRIISSNLPIVLITDITNKHSLSKQRKKDYQSSKASPVPKLNKSGNLPAKGSIELGKCTATSNDILEKSSSNHQSKKRKVHEDNMPSPNPNLKVSNLNDISGKNHTDCCSLSAKKTFSSKEKNTFKQHKIICQESKSQDLTVGVSPVLETSHSSEDKLTKDKNSMIGGLRVWEESKLTDLSTNDIIVSGNVLNSNSKHCKKNFQDTTTNPDVPVHPENAGLNNLVDHKSSRDSSTSSSVSLRMVQAKQMCTAYKKVLFEHHDHPAIRLGVGCMNSCSKDPYSCAFTHQKECSKMQLESLDLQRYWDQYFWSSAFDLSLSLQNPAVYPPVMELLHAFNVVLNTHEEEVLRLARMEITYNFSLHPPCAKNMKKYYRELLTTDTTGKDIIKISSDGLFWTILNLLTNLLPSIQIHDLEDNKSERSQDSESEEDYDQQDSGVRISAIGSATEKRKCFNRLSLEEKTNRAFFLLKHIMDLLEVDLPVFLVKYNFRTFPVNHHLSIPLLAATVWQSNLKSNEIGYINPSCRTVIKLYVTCYQNSLRSTWAFTIRKLLCHIGELACALDFNSQQDKYPYLGKRIVDLAREISQSFCVLDRESMEEAVSDLMPEPLKLLVTNFLLNRGEETVPSLSTAIDLVNRCGNREEEPTNDMKEKRKTTKDDINKRNDTGETKLHRACRRNRIDQLKQLLQDPDIDVNAQDNFGWTPIHEAVKARNMECVELLLTYKPPPGKRKLNLRLKSKDGTTPLMDAVENYDIQCCKMLLDHGGPSLLNDVNITGMSVLDLAPTKEIEILLKKSAYCTDACPKDELLPPNASWLLPLFVESYIRTYQTQEILLKIKEGISITEGGEKLEMEESEKRKGRPNLKFNYVQYKKDFEYLMILKKLVKEKITEMPGDYMLNMLYAILMGSPYQFT